MTRKKSNGSLNTGIKVIEVDSDFLEYLENTSPEKRAGHKTYTEIERKDIDQPFIKKHKLYSNMGLVLKDKSKKRPTLLARTSRDNKELWLLNEGVGLWGNIKPLNKEQKILTNFLLDPKILLHVVVGPAGSGKTLLTSAYALQMLYEKKMFRKIILTKSMDIVGRHKLGAMPGDIKEKFDPYLINFQTTFEQLYGERGMDYYSVTEEKSLIRYVPIQLMRGASFKDTLIIVDEAQNLDYHETKTIGTRLGEGCKLIFLGDLTQIDRPKFSKTKTGLHHLMQGTVIKNSGMASTLELIKNVRSPLSNLIEEAFADTDSSSI